MLKILWDWSVGARDFDQAVNTASIGGFDAFSLTWRRVKAEERKGRSARDLAAYAADHGVRLEFLDGASCWAPTRFPEGSDAEVSAAFDFSPEEAFELCGEAGLTRIVALGAFHPGTYSIAELTDSFAAFCAAAAKYDLHVCLESIASIGGLRSLSEVWSIVRDANCDNSSIILDTWHFMRVDADFELLSSITPGCITDVQIVDGPLAPVDPNPWIDGMKSRTAAGSGAMPLARILNVVKERHNLITVGPEWYNSSMDQLSIEQLARCLDSQTCNLLREANLHFGS